ncbi:MAG: Bax inhibitor-1/YccA family protein [Actinomycetota bacterium]
MANPALNEKRFETEVDEWNAGWAAPRTGAPGTAADGQARSTDRNRVMTANGTFAKTFVLFLVVLVGGAFGWRQTVAAPADQIAIPGWIWIFALVGFGLAMVCIFRPRTAPFVAPLYALAQGVFLGSISKAFELQWDGIVFQAVLATVGVFFATLALYVFGVVKVTKKFQAVVIGATLGILVMYVLGLVLSLFGVDMVFWNEPTPLGIIISVVICVVASLNLFLDYEFIRTASLAGAPKHMEWYGAFGIMVTLVWLYLEVLRLLSLLRR